MASTKASIDVMKMKGDVAPDYQANLIVDAYVSLMLIRAGVRVEGTIGAGSLAVEVLPEDNTLNLRNKFELPKSMCS